MTERGCRVFSGPVRTLYYWNGYRFARGDFDGNRLVAGLHGCFDICDSDGEPFYQGYESFDECKRTAIEGVDEQVAGLLSVKRQLEAAATFEEYEAIVVAERAKELEDIRNRKVTT